jgi:PhzF family phenazine biosynthesis protein
VDAFTDRPFSGNPAAVCVLEYECDVSWMQSVAAEMNLSETAFVRRLDDGFELRWFTPAVEVDLCGHATLASAFTLWKMGLAPPDKPIRFHTHSGALTAQCAGEFIELDFPATPPETCDPPGELLDALRVKPIFVAKTKFDRFLVLDSAQTLRSLRPNFNQLAEIATRGVIVTAASDDARFDFISRFFAPASGVNEDPVTGSAHCCLGPFWGKQLGKTSLVGYQASPRGGIVHVRLNGERVILGGQAVLVWRGELVLSAGWDTGLPRRASKAFLGQRQ